MDSARLLRDTLNPDHHLGRIGLEVLILGGALRLEDEAQLAGRLYRLNRWPASERWRRREDLLRDATLRAASAAGLERGGWQSVQDPHGWLSWRADSGVGDATVKLYVSPEPSMLPEALSVAGAVARECGAIGAKAGGDVYGFLRPDKLVFYFADFGPVAAVGACLAERLRSVGAHGVPLTIPLDERGLISWGFDPRPELSWRRWATHHLAAGLTARRDPRPWRAMAARLGVAPPLSDDLWTRLEDSVLGAAR